MINKKHLDPRLEKAIEAVVSARNKARREQGLSGSLSFKHIRNLLGRELIVSFSALRFALEKGKIKRVGKETRSVLEKIAAIDD